MLEVSSFCPHLSTEFTIRYTSPYEIGHASLDATATQNDVSLPALAGLGPALRRAWVGYQLRLDASMAEAGFEDVGSPTGGCFACARGKGGSTISAIGRELEITRQGASKLVRLLGDRGYVLVTESETSKREKTVVLTPRGRDYLQSLR